MSRVWDYINYLLIGFLQKLNSLDEWITCTKLYPF